MLGELQWTLIGVVVLILVAVLIYNRWQERRAQDSANKIFAPPTRLEGDVFEDGGLNLDRGLDLDAGARDSDEIDPPWQNQQESRPVQTAFPIETETPWSLAQHGERPTADETGSESFGLTATPVPVATIPAAPVVSVPSPLNADIEFIIRFPFRLTADRALADLVDRMRVGQGLVRVLGQHEDSGEWSPIEHYSTTVYAQAEVGILLANRKGPTRQDVLQEACLSADRYASSHGGVAQYTDIALASRQAIDLDRFCMEVDKLIDFSVVVPEGFPFSGEVLARLVVEQGMQYQPSGSFVMPGAEGETLFSLVNMEPAPFPANGEGLRTHGVTLMLEVPRCKDGLLAFDRMIALGDFLADKLSARVVDSQGRPITGTRLQQDRAVLSEACSRLNDHGIAPGSEQALRLFA